MNLTAKDVTPAVKSAVNAYLMARAHAETMREHVDRIERAILAECPLTNSFFESGSRRERKEVGETITDPKYAFLCEDRTQLEDFYAESNKRKREAGLKPSDMPDEFCPALVAESLQRDTEHLIIYAATIMLKMEFDGKEMYHRLLCRGLKDYQKFIDLVVGLVVNLPDFKNPLNGKGIKK